MRSSKFNPLAEFHAMKSMVFNGKVYLKGDHFPKQGINLSRIELLFNQNTIGYEWQANIKARPVIKQADVEAPPKPEMPATEREQKKPKKASAKKKKAAKKEGEDS